LSVWTTYASGMIRFHIFYLTYGMKGLNYLSNDVFLPFTIKIIILLFGLFFLISSAIALWALVTPWNLPRNTEAFFTIFSVHRSQDLNLVHCVWLSQSILLGSRTYIPTWDHNILENLRPNISSNLSVDCSMEPSNFLLRQYVCYHLTSTMLVCFDFLTKKVSMHLVDFDLEVLLKLPNTSNLPTSP